MPGPGKTADEPIRWLRVTVRSAAASSLCDRAWARLRAAVTAAGGRAWRFRDAAGTRYLEFIEWKAAPGAPGVPDHAEVGPALRALERCGRTESEETWQEAEG